MQRVVLLAVLVATFGSFIWAMRRFFRLEGEKPRGLVFLERAGSVCLLADAAAFLMSPLPGTPYTFLAVGLYILSGALFAWALATNLARPLSIIYSPDAPVHLVEQGPYRWVRHPFYVSYYIAWSAAVVGTMSPWLVPTLLMGWLYHDAARFEERKFAQSELADAYRSYCLRTGRFLPRFRRNVSRPAGSPAMAIRKR
jgi:protein-S-isoprenylcysteine O-methyltransferase Ste14